MFSEIPTLTPDVGCYEECVVTDHFGLLVSPTPTAGLQPSSPFAEGATNRAGIPKSSSGKVTKKSRPRPRTLKDKKCSSPLIMKWLGDNYEDTPGGCLPRSVLYTHYQDFCKRNQLEPSSAASFGKIIRLKFPDLRTRRLGTRGQSKYHYYGLAIQETSIYYRSSYSKKGLTRFSNACIKRESGQTYNPSAKTGILLPEFPKTKDLRFTKPFPIEKVETFLLMYRAHCQRILDAIVRINFQEIQDFLIHFWQGMPAHMLPILSSQTTVDLVVVCDFILYSSICEVLIPATLQQVSESLRESTEQFSHNLVEWLFTALQDLPAPLGIRKVQTAEMFGKCLRKELSLLQIAKNARTVIRSSDTMTCIINDWRVLNTETVIAQARCNGQHLSELSMALFREFSRELEQMFIKQSTLEVYFEWLDSIIERNVKEPADKGLSQLANLSVDFQNVWSCFSLSIEQELMMTNGNSLESFRMIGAVLQEYVSYVVELLQYRLIEKQYSNVLIIPECSQPPFDPRHFNNCPPGLLQASFLPPSPLQTPSKSVSYFHMFGQQRQMTDYPTDGYYLNHHPITSPNYQPITDTFCDSFFKQELGSYSHPSCSVPSTLPLENETFTAGYIDMDNPLTPQSSHHSLSSPLSHTTLGSSPEPSLEIDFSRPHSQISVHSIGSPNMADVPHMGDTRSHSSASSGCTSPLTHDPECTLNIAASLELVAQGSNTTGVSYEYLPHERDNLIASYPADPYAAHLPTPCGMGGYRTESIGYAQYEYDLLNFMTSEADELLADPFSGKETKPSLSQLSSPCTPATTPIH